MGHELAGRVVSRGDSVTALDEGARVAVLPGARCGVCEHCRAGRTHLCVDQFNTALGLGLNPGGFAEYVRTPARACYLLPDHVTPEGGALVEPFAVGLHAVRRSRAFPGAAVGIIGAGPIGLMVLAALRAAGVDGVAVAERSPTRAEVAQTLGAAAVVADVGRLTDALGTQPDVVFECAGAALTPQAAIEAVRPGGEVVLVGVADPTEQLQLTSFLWVVKEVDVHPAIAYTSEEFGEAVDAVATGVVETGTVVSDVCPLEDAEASFAALTGPEPPVKVLLRP